MMIRSTASTMRRRLTVGLLVGLVSIAGHGHQARCATVLSPASRISIGVSAYVAESCTISNDPRRAAASASCAVGSPFVVGSVTPAGDDSAQVTGDEAGSRYVTVTF